MCGLPRAKPTELSDRIKAVREFRLMLAAHLRDCEHEPGEEGRAAQRTVMTVKRA